MVANLKKFTITARESNYNVSMAQMILPVNVKRSSSSAVKGIKRQIWAIGFLLVQGSDSVV